jgi:hypothetical protein
MTLRFGSYALKGAGRRRFEAADTVGDWTDGNSGDSPATGTTYICAQRPVVRTISCYLLNIRKGRAVLAARP